MDKFRALVTWSFEILDWPRSDCRYLMGHFNAGWPWRQDYLAARQGRVPVVKLWAYDHLCLFSCDLPLPAEVRTH